MTRREPDSAEFERLIKCLDPDTGKAWNQYDLLRRKLVRYFEGYRCGDAEELACEVLDRIAKRPDLESIRSIPEFAVGVARNLRKESHRREQRVIPLEDCPAGTESLIALRNDGENIGDNARKDPMLECLEICLARLNERDRVLTVQYYNSEGTKLYLKRRLLAVWFGFTANALRVHMNRLREKLERDVVECFGNRPPIE